MTTQSMTRRQHYVPRCLLTKFCGQDDNLFVFRKENGKVFKSSPNNVACESWLYEVSEGAAQQMGLTLDETVNVAENALSVIEGRFATARDKVLANSVVGLGQEEKVELAHYIAIQWLRTPSFRRNQIAQYEQWMNETLNLAVAQELGPEAVGLATISIDPDFVSRYHLATLFNPAMWSAIAGALLNHVWYLGVDAKGRLCTSDVGVAVRAHLHSEVKSGLGLSSPGIEISFPISPNQTIIMRERSFHKEVAGQEDKSVNLSDEDGRILNAMQTAYADRFCFSKREDFSDIEGFLQKNPALRTEAPFLNAVNEMSIPNGMPPILHFQLVPRDIDWS